IGAGTLATLRQQAAELGVTPWDALQQAQVLDDFPARGAKALRGFRDLIVALQREAETLALPEMLRRLLEATGYLEMYEKRDADSEARLENIEEFLSAAQEFAEQTPGIGPLESLTAFLDHIALTTDLDAWKGGGGVMLMTLHSAKGLEFPIVVVAGLEEGVLPHFNSQGKLEDLEEERRLLYVGMTRAKERLLLSCCRRRRVAGRWQDQLESRFLSEVPEKLVDLEESAERFVDERAWGVYSFFDKPAPRTWGSGAGRDADVDEDQSQERRVPAMAARSAAGPAAASGRRGAGVGGAPQRSSPSSSWRPQGSAPPVRSSTATISRPAAVPSGRTGAVGAGGLRRGAKVRHPTLGQGTVMEVEGEGPTGRITVYFEKFGKRKLVSQFAKLEPV
ncbi:MAG TPA: 3'-5' exonuclease, partial [Thermoanaerobaculia bacterium]|nr:3'-5' exonuclease [Thermoanaerobaculia bacterium]